MITRPCWFLPIGTASLCLVLAACGGSSSSSSPQPPQDSASSTGAAATGSASGDSDTLDINAIFPSGPGRDLTLENCLSCHTIVPLVVLQMDKDGWARNAREHRERVDSLTDEQFKAIYDYLSANFNPDHPVPKLPRDMLDTWTAY